jgi:hypothetical protein
MSSDVTKRALSAGLGVGALALLAPRASADTPFSSFAFPATGAPTARTLPDRLGELKTVKDFGARGNGVADDTAAIQAAVNSGGTTYFPAGSYYVTRPIRTTRVGFINIYGDGAGIVANFPDYIFHIDDGEDDAATAIFEGFYMDNPYFPQSGAIKINHGTNHIIRRCNFNTPNPIWIGWCQNSTVEDCFLRPGANNVPPGSIGIQLATLPTFTFGGTFNARVLHCDLNGFEHGIRTQGGASISDCRIEQCRFGIVVGMDSAGNEYPSGAFIANTAMEACGTFIWLRNGGYGVHLQGIAMQLDEGFSGAPDGGESLVGLLIDQSAWVVATQIFCVGPLRDACIKFTGDLGTPVIPRQGGSVFTSVIGVAQDRPGAVGWRGMELLDRSKVTFIQCNNPPLP